MNKKIQLILHGLSLFISSIIVFTLTLLLLAKVTLLNSSYILKMASKSNTYHDLFERIKEEMLYYIPQSGFKKDIIDDTFTYADVYNDVNTVIKNIYNNKKTEIDTSTFSEKLNSKIDAYVEEENFTVVNKEELHQFTVEMAKIYVSKVKLNGFTDRMGSYFAKVNKLVNRLLIICMGLFLVSLIINMLFFKFKKVGIILFTNSFMLLSFHIFIKRSITIKNIFVYNDLVSNIIKNVLNNLLSYIVVILILNFIFGILIKVGKCKRG